MLTFGADPSQVGHFHQHAGKHVRLVWASAAGVHLQCLQQGLLQFVHLLWLLQVHSIWNNKDKFYTLKIGSNKKIAVDTLQCNSKNKGVYWSRSCSPLV